MGLYDDEITLEIIEKYEDIELKEKLRIDKNETNKQWRKNNIEKILRYKYNISYNDWLIIWENQSGRCAICREIFIKPSDACIDHSHKTGKVRGLLCRKCNAGIGFFCDNSKLLTKAIKYLKRGKLCLGQKKKKEQ